MISRKKAMLCLVLGLGAQAMHAGQYYVQQPCYGFQALNPSTVASNQRIADAMIKVAFSNEAKKQSAKFLLEWGKLCAKQLRIFFQAVMKEIKPQDAKRVLAALDAMDAFLVKASKSLKNILKMSPQQQQVIFAALQYDAEMLCYDMLEFCQAFEKHQALLVQKLPMELHAALFKSFETTLEILRDIRSVVEVKARS